MMRHLGFSLLLLAGLTASACQSPVPVTSAIQRTGYAAVMRLGEAEHVTPQSVAQATPSPTPTPAPAAASESPSPSPTPRRGGSGGGGSGGSGGGGAAPPPVAVPSPGLRSNTIATGPGELSGRVLDVIHGGAPVVGATLTVTAVADPAQQAVLVVEADGTFVLSGLALGAYTVEAERTGYTASTAPVTVTLYTSASTLGSVNLTLVAP